MNCLHEWLFFLWFANMIQAEIHVHVLIILMSQIFGRNIKYISKRQTMLLVCSDSWEFKSQGVDLFAKLLLQFDPFESDSTWLKFIFCVHESLLSLWKRFSFLFVTMSLTFVSLYHRLVQWNRFSLFFIFFSLFPATLWG